MKKLTFLFLASSAGLLLSSCSDSNEGGWKYGELIEIPVTVGPLELTAAETTANDRLNNFAFDFLNISAHKYEEMFNGNPKDNFTISPLSATMALGLMANSGDAALSDEICHALGVEGTNVLNSTCNKLLRYLAWQNETETLELANSMWYRKDLQISDSYRNVFNKVYYSEVSGVDFTDNATVNIINSWAAAKTRNMIPRVINQINPNTDIIYANAMYFSGRWNKVFDKDKTVETVFYGTKGTSKVMMMHNKYNGSYFEGEKCAAVRLDFAKSIGMYIVLPYKDVTIEELSEEFNYHDWLALKGNKNKYSIDLSLPRFEINGMANLTPMLNALGIRNTYETTAFGGTIAGKHSISQITSSKVDEEGARIASVTNDIMIGMPAGRPIDGNVVFNVDSPFLFFITDINSGTVLMAGRICNL